jgi:SAM-dependent methyltransferase
VVEIEGAFDVVMFNHSLEHVPNPENDLRAAAELAKAGGNVIVRVPIAGTYAWRRYRENWVQLDAPRHLTIPTVDGLITMAERCGLEVIEQFFESTAFQFWGSEQYIRDIPLTDHRSYRHKRSASPFGGATIASFSRRAEELNAALDGDCACFILKPM